MVYADAGDEARAQQILQDFKEKARREYVPPIALAWAYMAVGNLNGAFASMNKLYEQLHLELVFLNVHVIHDRRRGDPRFQALLRKIGITESQIAAADALAGERGEHRRPRASRPGPLEQRYPLSPGPAPASL